jgi:stringent starvation protein B
MTPPRPYLIRAFYDWIIDNNLTPYIIIDATAEGISVPQEYVKDDKIVLNIAAHVVHGLSLGNQVIQFKARFGGVPRTIFAPVAAVTAIYAKENGRGMVFTDEDIQGDEGEGGGETEPTPPTTPIKPKLRIVK